MKVSSLFFSPVISAIVLGIVACAAPGVRAATPFLETNDLFVAAPGDYYHIPGLVVTSKGTVLAYAAWRQKETHDWGNIKVHLRRSTDGGKTWDAIHQVAPQGDPVQAIVRSSPPKPKGHEDDVTVDNGVMIADRNGAVHMLYCVEYRRVFYMRSDDDGVTWSTPKEISKVFENYRPEINWKIVATGPGHGIQLNNARLEVPVWLATGSKTGYSHQPSMAAMTFSDDHGASWQTGDIVARTTGLGTNPAVYHNPNETEAVQLADGSVMFIIRAPSAHQRKVFSLSPNGATDWSKPQFVEDLPEPVNFGSIRRLSKKPTSDKNRLLYSITGSLETRRAKSPDEKSCKREDMTVFLSYDEGQTWPVKKIMQQGPAGCGYSDLAVLPDGTILCAHGAGAGFGSGARIALARFNLEWLTDGRDSVPQGTADPGVVQGGRAPASPSPQ